MNTAPLRTLDDVKACITRDKPRGVDTRMARLMLKHGRLTDEARAWLEQEYTHTGKMAS